MVRYTHVHDYNTLTNVYIYIFRMNNQKFVASYLFGVILVALWISGILSRECLFDDQMLTPEGECVDCPFCPGGEGMDLEQEVVSPVIC